MAYHVYKMGDKSLADARARTDKFIEAQAIADEMHKKTGDHYVVLSIASVWSTQTVDDLLREDRSKTR